MSSKPMRSEITEPQATSIQTETGEASVRNSALDDQIRRRAYEIYLERGEQPGRGLEDWFQAERELRNKAIALRLVQVFNGRRLDLLEDVLHPEFRGRGISAFPPDGPDVGPGARRKLYEMFYQAIPDARAEVLDVVAEGDKVVLVDRFGGTHRGEFFGRPGTGDRIEWIAIHIYTIRDGKVLEDAVMTDALAMMQQLGLVPSLTKAAERGAPLGI
jgi:predicted ester cyclase